MMRYLTAKLAQQVSASLRNLPLEMVQLLD